MPLGFRFATNSVGITLAGSAEPYRVAQPEAEVLSDNKQEREGGYRLEDSAQATQDEIRAIKIIG